MMRIDMREHVAVREQVYAGLIALKIQGRQIWGDKHHTLDEVVPRLMVGVGDLARLVRDGFNLKDTVGYIQAQRELKKELGNIIFSTIRWVDDLGFNVLECLDLAIEAQEKFAQSSRPR